MEKNYTVQRWYVCYSPARQYQCIYAEMNTFSPSFSLCEYGILAKVEHIANNLISNGTFRSVQTAQTQIRLLLKGAVLSRSTLLSFPSAFCVRISAL